MANADEVFKEISALQDAVLKVWTMYLNWFTWSLGLNLLAISYITTHDPIRKDFLSALSFIMSVSIVLAFGAGMKMQSYHRDVLVRMKTLALEEPEKRINTHLLVGGNIGAYASSAILAVQLIALAGWVLAALKYGERIL